MRFDYIKVVDFPSHQARARLLPWIRFGIFNPKNPEKLVFPLGLVDSGSDATIVDFELGEELGLTIRKGKKSQIVGVGGGYIDVYFNKVGFNIHDGSKARPVIFEDYVAFSSKPFSVTMPQQTAILGTIGFFRHLKVTFEYPKQILIEHL